VPVFLQTARAVPHYTLSRFSCPESPLGFNIPEHTAAHSNILLPSNTSISSTPSPHSPHSASRQHLLLTVPTRVATPNFASQVLLLFGGVTPTTHINKVRHNAVGGSQKKRKGKQATWAHLSTTRSSPTFSKRWGHKKWKEKSPGRRRGHCERER